MVRDADQSPTFFPSTFSSTTAFLSSPTLMAIKDYFVTDDLTILLGLIAVTVFLLYNLYKPQPLVHPILLGRQSDVGRVRNPGESALYRNYNTGLLGRVCSICLQGAWLLNLL
jgi:hypothetical protein